MNDPKTLLEPICGYMVDMWSKLRNQPYVPHSLMKLHNVSVAQRRTGATTIIEIGSYKGVTARRLSYLFDKVYTVEIDPTLHEQAKKRCVARANVELILGDGIEVLARLAPRVRNCIVFLDGHFSGGETGIGHQAEPVLIELDAVRDYLENFDSFIVDDFRLFGTEEGWPSKGNLLHKIDELFKWPKWEVLIHNDQIMVLRRLN